MNKSKEHGRTASTEKNKTLEQEKTKQTGRHMTLEQAEQEVLRFIDKGMNYHEIAQIVCSQWCC